MKKILFALLTLSGLISCGPTIKVISDYDKTMDVSVYKTYRWLDKAAIEEKGTDPRYINELTDKRIRAAVDRELGILGIRSVTGPADMALHYHILVDTKTMMVNEPAGTRYNRHLENKKLSIYQYKEGTLLIDMMDLRTNELVWRGGATDVITAEAEKDPELAINNAIAEIMKKSPFRTK
ncbi:MAG: DUF4136 domain-containing protein [Chitinophagaceae bacterium]|nr:DUF4136 domain-containing protein [Chitinophagaceae bacterium]MBL0055952.1 DUF4136 domain-containing protein [Chitinophagaceae bacterium]